MTRIFKSAKKGSLHTQFNQEQLFLTAIQESKRVYAFLKTRKEGLYVVEALERRKEYGENKIVSEKTNWWFILLIKAFINPFIGILMFLAVVSIIIDVLLASPDEKEWITPIIMVTLSALLRFVQE